MKSKLLLFYLIVFGSTSFSQIDITWVDLKAVEVEEKYVEEYDSYLPSPSFSASILALEGQQVRITGYFLDIDPKGRLYVLSQGPMASCFFCGVGGPETAIELYFSSNQSFKTDDLITVTGKLQLNRSSFDQMYYILNDSKAELTANKLKK